MISILWFIAFLGPQGPVTVSLNEKATFADAATCETFGNIMTPRMQDWIRGRINAEWDHQVAVRFRCGPAGQPA